MSKEKHILANIRGFLDKKGFYEYLAKIKCFFKGHKYNYQVGNWLKGRYEDIYLTCDRCGKNFYKVTLTEIGNPNNDT
jgi:hypothetical protein